LQIEVDVYCQWIDECERMEQAKRKQEAGHGLGLIRDQQMAGATTSAGQRSKEERKRPTSDSEDEDSYQSINEENEEVSEDSESEEEEEEVARPVKRGPAFGNAAAKKPQPPKHKYLEPTGRITENQANEERQNLVGKKRLHR
jgi:hypothetical protein